MATVPFFFLILSKPQLILGNIKSRSTCQTQLTFITSYRSSLCGVAHEGLTSINTVQLILVTDQNQQRREKARYVKSVWEGILLVEVFSIMLVFVCLFFWRIHENFLQANLPWGNRSHIKDTKSCFPMGNNHLPIDKMASATAPIFRNFWLLSPHLHFRLIFRRWPQEIL